MTRDPLNAFLEQRWWLLLSRGIILAGFGLFFLIQPMMGILLLMMVFGMLCIMDGTFALATSFGRARNGGRWVWLAIEAVAVIIIGVLVLAMPSISLMLFYLVVAIRAGLSGLLLLLTATQFNGDHGRNTLILAGILSLGFATLLMFAPVIGLKVMAWWLGVWLLAFGTLFLLLGWRLRRNLHTPRI